MAGDLEPTAGEVIKSSKDLRVAFLRQEFVDELVMERSLKEELISVFTEEAAILEALQGCEVRYSRLALALLSLHPLESFPLSKPQVVAHTGLFKALFVA